MRESGKLLFPIFRDGTGVMQGVVSLKENPEAFAAMKGLTQESSVVVTGKIRAEQRAPGGFEMGVSSIQVLQKVSEATPFPGVPSPSKICLKGGFDPTFLYELVYFLDRARVS